MALVIADPKTADRLADAAQLLLDAARGSVAEHVAAGGHIDRPAMHASAISVQTLLAADQWPAGGMASAPGGIEVDPGVLTEKIAGAAIGLGLVLGQIPDGAVRAALVLMVGQSLAHGVELSRAAAANRAGGA